jgi:SOS-response transcriptional repressor LexA
MGGLRIEKMPKGADGRVAPTPRQREILDAGIRLAAAGYPPTLRELAQAVGIRSLNGLRVQLDALRRKGWVDWREGCARTLRFM